MSVGEKIMLLAGVLVLVATFLVVGYYEWWGSDVDGIDRGFYVAGLVVGLALVATPLLSARRSARGRARGVGRL